MNHSSVSTLKSLTNLQHDLIDSIIKNPHLLEWIQKRGRAPLPCELTVHPGKTCFQYWPDRISRSLKFALKIQIIVTVLPALILKRKQLYSNFKKTVKIILRKFAQETFFVTMGPSFTFISQCLMNTWLIRKSKMHLLPFRLRIVLITLTGLWTLLVQEQGKILSYLGFYIPNSISLIYQILKTRGLIGSMPFESQVTLFMAATLLGLAASRFAKRK